MMLVEMMLMYRVAKLSWIVIALLLIISHSEVVQAQEAAPISRPVINPLAVGGMVQGLLDIQIRPQGGFYEDRYKDLFPDDSVVAVATTSDFDRRHTVTNSLKTKNIIAEDGRLLLGSTTGRSPNPCFDEKRVARNRLLFLICSLQLASVNSENEV